jgi:drug/metabolite transporter (DMT)-like permease
MKRIKQKIHEAKGKLVFTYTLMLLAMIFWSFSFIWTKMLLKELNPISIITIRLMLSSFFLVIAGLAIGKLQKLKLNDLPYFLLLVLFEPFLYFLGETNGLRYVSATVSSILIALIPLFTPFATYFIYKEKLNVLNFIGIFISFIGVILVIVKKDLSFNASIEGILLMCLAVFSAIGYSLFVLKILDKYNIFSIIVYQNLFGALYFLPLLFYFDFEHLQSVNLDFDLLYPLLALAILASSLAFMMYTYGIKMLGVVKANTISNSIPVLTALFAYFLLNEKLTLINILGILIVLSGLLLSQIRKAIRIRHRIFFFKKVNDIKE